MRSKYIVMGIVVGVLLSSVVVVLAGQIDSPAGPTAAGGQMYTLEQIYDRLSDGRWVTKMTTFTEPGSGPGATARTLNEIMAVAKPGALAKRVNKTGQTDCYKSASPWGTCTCGTADCPSGQDGDYEMGIDPAIAPSTGTTGSYNTPAWTGVRFTDNGDGTVTDNLTGLIWLKNANCPNGGKNWNDALTFANSLYDGWTGDPGGGDCSLSDGSSDGDWRLPNVRELYSLIHSGQRDSATWLNGQGFSGVQSDDYWSSTTYARYTYYAWNVHLGDGDVYGDYLANTYYVWPVRGG